MKLTRVVALALWGMAALSNQQETVNVNSRYTVEKIEIQVTGAKDCCKLSDGLRQDLVKLVGQKFDQEAISELSKKIRKEMCTDDVAQKLTRGEKPEHVTVTLEAASTKKSASFGFNGSNLGNTVYHSKQGWSGGGEFALHTSVLPAQTLAFGLVDNGVDQTERYAGITGRYEIQPFAVRQPTSSTVITATAGAPPAASESATTTTTTATTTTTTITGDTTTTSTVTGHTTTTTTSTGKGVSAGDRVKLGFLFESFHIQWNPATVGSLARREGGLSLGEIYRNRLDFKPTVKMKLRPSVDVTVGASFERMEKQFPAGHDTANAVIANVRYSRELGDAKTTKWNLSAGYDLRAATRIFSSDYVYARHLWDASFAETWGNSSLSSALAVGAIWGRAPLFERYSLGDVSSLRGWNKYDLDPVGGNRMAHSETEYKYRMVKVFYDTGSVWSRGETAVARNSAGIGLQGWGPGKWKFLPQLAVAFPIRSGRVEPVFMVIL